MMTIEKTARELRRRIEAAGCGDTLESVAGQLNSYSKRLKEAEVERERLAEIRNKLETEPMGCDEWEELFSFYSDFYKDVYGHRPRDVVRPF